MSRFLVLWVFMMQTPIFVPVNPAAHLVSNFVATVHVFSQNKSNSIIGRADLAFMTVQKSEKERNWRNSWIEVGGVTKGYTGKRSRLTVAWSGEG